MASGGVKIARTVAAVAAGYVVFALASMQLVGRVLRGSGAVTTVLGAIGLLLIGLVAGLVARLLAGETRALAAAVVAGLVVLATVANLAFGLGAEPAWYKVVTLFLTAPAIAIAGRYPPPSSQAI